MYEMCKKLNTMHISMHNIPYKHGIQNFKTPNFVGALCGEKFLASSNFNASPCGIDVYYEIANKDINF
jgi:hypothetical protein